MCNIFKIDLVWPEQVGTSTLFSPLLYLIFTCILAATFSAFQILRFCELIPEFKAFYFTFLTNWTLILETITVVMLFICTAWAYAISCSSPKPAPHFVRVTMVLWYIVQPMSLIVMIMYWTLINEFWDANPVKISCYWAHLLNWLVLLTCLFVSRIPWSLKNGIYGLLFILAYLIWTLIHFFARIGTEKPCENYPQPECPIYKNFDWNKPGRTSVITVASLVGYLVVAGIYTALVRFRDACG